MIHELETDYGLQLKSGFESEFVLFSKKDKEIIPVDNSVWCEMSALSSQSATVLGDIF